MNAGKLIAAFQDSHKATRLVGNYLHYSCAACGQPVGRSGALYPPMEIVKCFQSGCQFHSWTSAYEYLAYLKGDTIQNVRDKVKRSLSTVVYDVTGSSTIRAAKAVLPNSLPITIGGGLYYNNAIKYLKKRGFDINYLWDNFSLTYTQNGDIWGERIIVPFKSYSGELLYYQGRDYTQQSELRWMNPSNEDVPFGKSEVIYNEEALYIFDKVFICEGAGDVWELHNAVATQGKQPSPYQLHKLTKSNALEYYLVFDPGAWRDTVEAGFTLLATGKPVFLIEMTDGDANEVGKDEVERLCENAVLLTYDNFEQEYSRIEFGAKGHTYRGKEKSTITLWS